MNKKTSILDKVIEKKNLSLSEEKSNELINLDNEKHKVYVALRDFTFLFRGIYTRIKQNQIIYKKEIIEHLLNGGCTHIKAVEKKESFATCPKCHHDFPVNFSEGKIV